MTQRYGIALRFQGNGTWNAVEHPGSTNLSRTMQSEASEVIGKLREIGICGFWYSPFTLSFHASLTHLHQIVMY